MVRTIWRRFAGCGALAASPRSSGALMTLVIEAGCTVSCAASSPGIIVAGRPGAASFVPESPGSWPRAIRPA
jgi:hypothetical protein